MIANKREYKKAQHELRRLSDWLERLQKQNPHGKGLTKAGIRKMMARLHEELALCEGEQELAQAYSR